MQEGLQALHRAGLVSQLPERDLGLTKGRCSLGLGKPSNHHPNQGTLEMGRETVNHSGGTTHWQCPKPTPLVPQPDDHRDSVSPICGPWLTGSSLRADALSGPLSLCLAPCLPRVESPSLFQDGGCPSLPFAIKRLLLWAALGTLPQRVMVCAGGVGA